LLTPQHFLPRKRYQPFYDDAMIRPSKAEREKFHVDYSQDTEFSAFARLLQSKWRDKKGYKHSKYGNFLEIDFAKISKANFLTDNIRQLVSIEVLNAKKNGGLISEPRIWNNLLSSQPLCFNLFGELHYDLELATKFFKTLFPSRIERITCIKFEYSPGRGDAEYLEDHSAFDVFVEYTNKGKNGFIGIEVKYAESLKEETKEIAKKNFKEKYATITENCRLFKPNCIDKLKQPPMSQIWRDHLLSIATRKDYDEGFFVFLFPSKNSQCQNGVNSYQELLFTDNGEQTGFYPRHLDLFIRTLRELHDVAWTKELEERYLGN